MNERFMQWLQSTQQFRAHGSATRTGLEIRAAADDEIDMLIYDQIGSGMFSYGVTAKDVVAQLANIGPKPVNVRINSPGGDVFEGAAIYNALKSHSAPVRTSVDGIAASAASIIAMAGAKCSMAENTMMMIHNPYCMAMGDGDELRATADILDKLRANFIDTYAAKSGMGKREIGQMMDDETWMTAKEAKANGFCDEVAEPGKQTATAHFDLSVFGFRRVPDSLSAKSKDKTYTVDGEELKLDAFAYQDKEDPKLPIKFSTDAKTESHIRDAVSRWSQTDMPDEAEKEKARGRIKAAAKEHNIELSDDDLKDAAELELMAHLAKSAEIERELEAFALEFA